MPINSQMRGLILENFGFRPTKEQENATKMIADFLFQRHAESVFVLRGYAGTGKTTLVGALVRTLMQLKQQVVLMAPTGRAAKVFALHADHPAHTIHRRIYRQKSFTGDMTGFLEGVNLLRHTLFIVDEASMIANSGVSGSAFGSGHLLDDLIHFVYSGEGCRLMLVGDTAQLPPVGEEDSPALSNVQLEGYGLDVCDTTLTEVVRQLEDSGILWNATQLRRMLAEDELYAFPELRLAGFADIVRLPGSDLIEALEQSYYRCGLDETIVVTRSNSRANIYNNGIRARILDYDSELTSGDQVIIVKNNYHWLKPEQEKEEEQEANKAQNPLTNRATQKEQKKLSMDFIANGDVAVVRRMRSEREIHGFRFADVLLRFPDYDDIEVEATIILDTLHSEAPALTHKQQESLFQNVWEDYPELTTKRDRMKAVKEDPYFNALQIKYAYAITCHKAQGGQWQQVFIDQGVVSEDMPTPDYFRWLYTALTRATDKVYLVNWPMQELDTESRLQIDE